MTGRAALWLALLIAACGGNHSDEAEPIYDARRSVDAALPSRVDIEPGPIDSLEFVRSTRRLRAVVEGRTYEYDVVTGQPTAATAAVAAPIDQLPWGEPVAASMTPGGEVMVAAYASGRLRVVDVASLATGFQVARAVDAGGDVRSVAVTDDGQRVFSAVGPKVALWSMAESRSLRTMRVADGAFAVSGSGNALATVLSGQLVVRHVPGGSVALSVPYTEGSVFALSPDGTALAVAAGDGRAALHPTTIPPALEAAEVEPAKHWVDRLAGASDSERALLRAWDEQSRAGGKRAAIADATLRATPPHQLALTEYAVVDGHGVATKISAVVDDRVRDVKRRPATWRAALEVTDVRCVRGEGDTTCFATARNASGTPIPIEMSIDGAVGELAHGAGTALIESNATVDLALRATATRARELTVCVYALARSGGVVCSPVAAE